MAFKRLRHFGLFAGFPVRFHRNVPKFCSARNDRERLAIVDARLEPLPYHLSSFNRLQREYQVLAIPCERVAWEADVHGIDSFQLR